MTLRRKGTRRRIHAWLDWSHLCTKIQKRWGKILLVKCHGPLICCDFFGTGGGSGKLWGLELDKGGDEPTDLSRSGFDGPVSNVEQHQRGIGTRKPRQVALAWHSGKVGWFFFKMEFFKTLLQSGSFFSTWPRPLTLNSEIRGCARTSGSL